jgi:hypothetical protein
MAYYECVFIALGIQQAMRVGHIICGLQYFSTFSLKRHDFRKKVTEHKVCFSSSPQITSATFLILRRTERDMIKKVFGFHVKYPLFLSDFTES